MLPVKTSGECRLLRLVFTSDGVGVVRALKILHKWSHKRDGIGVRRIRTFPFSSDSAYDSVAYVLESERCFH